MTALERIAYFRNRRDEVPNQELAKALASIKDAKGIKEIAAHLWDTNKNIRSDCVKVMYEIGYLAPKLIAPYTSDFLALLRDKENRMVWGGMIALAAVASLEPKLIWNQVDAVMDQVDIGSVITVVWGIRVLAKVSAAKPAYKKKIFPYLLQFLERCLLRDLPLHAESILCTVNKKDLDSLLTILHARESKLTRAQMTRLKKVYRAMQKI